MTIDTHDKVWIWLKLGGSRCPFNMLVEGTKNEMYERFEPSPTPKRLRKNAETYMLGPDLRRIDNASIYAVLR